MDPTDVVLRFLEGVGRKSEAEFYLGLFRAAAKERFAAIAVDASVARHAFDAVVVDLRFLAALGLTPVVTFGLFEPTDALEHAAKLRRRLGKAGVPAEVVAPSDVDRIVAATRGATLPIVAYGTVQGTTVDERFDAFASLVATLETRKLIFLSRRGGLVQKGAPLAIVNLTKDFEAIAASKELSRKQQAILTQARRLVFEQVPHRLTVSMTSPFELLRELFTVRGAGTLLRRGAVIQRKEGLAEVDQARLTALVASSFGRAPTEGFLARPVSRIYLEEGYRGAAMMIDTPLGGYLTKFAVDREAQGEGLGRDLWDLMAVDYATVFWRARPENPINTWYAREADGLHRAADWHVFWKGLSTQRIPEAIAFARAQPVDLAES